MTRRPDARDLAYERLAGDWANVIDGYDTDRRVEVLIEEFLGDERIRGRSCLDAGCGLGGFSRALLRHAPRSLTAIDLAPTLVAALAHELPAARCLVGDLLDLGGSLGGERFEVVVSSEVVEHTPDPGRAIAQLCGRVAPGGFLVLSTPNASWRWTLAVARLLGLRRHYLGHEHWSWPRDFRVRIEREGLRVLRSEGIHLVPWQLVPKPWLRRADRVARGWSFGLSVNLALLAIRPS